VDHALSILRVIYTKKAKRMGPLTNIYGHPLSLLTDLYQLTMAKGYWRSGLAEREAAFHLFYRRNPFKGGYALACGLHAAIEWLGELRFGGDEIDYLAGLCGNDGARLLERGFLDFLRTLRFSCDVDAVTEGTVVFPHEPLVRVSGPVAQCQLIETALLNLINFQTLIATKAARICQATQGEPVLEFGLRRAQGVDGSLAASRAAYVGGCAATSNVLAGKIYGIPVRGTHAHSWVMLFDDELESFRAYAEAMPNNCVFLVDTYDTIDGVKHAIEVGKSLRERGHALAGIRLDSGDLAHLSIKARALLDEAGFEDTAIVASNDLDEHVITSLKAQGATIGVWGVGTRLATAYDQPALGGVYKLSAVRGVDGKWEHKIKLSEQTIKISNPGVLQVRRYLDGDESVADLIYDCERGAGDASVMYDVRDDGRQRRVPAHTAHRDLLQPIFRKGELVYAPPALEEVRTSAAAELAQVNPRIRRFVNPQYYPVGLEPSLFELKQALIARARGGDA